MEVPASFFFEGIDGQAPDTGEARGDILADKETLELIRAYPMRRRLPPFAAIRAFEASARNNSFTVAADELNVTQSAISHQVKRLEEFLDISLFVRAPQGLSLTPAGQDYLGELTGILDRLDASTRRLCYPDQPARTMLRA